MKAKVGEYTIDIDVLKTAYPKALLYAHRSLAKYRNSYVNVVLEPTDVVNEAVEKTLSGVRPWNKELTPDLFVHLAGSVKSIISNTYTSLNNTLGSRDDNLEAVFLKTQDSPEADWELTSRIELILDYLSDRKKELKEVAEFMLRSGVTTPRDISESLGLTVREVNKHKTEIKRLMLKPEFILFYIDENRPDLREVALSMFDQKKLLPSKPDGYIAFPLDKMNKQEREVTDLVDEVRHGVF